jgi:hypothetical protein
MSTQKPEAAMTVTGGMHAISRGLSEAAAIARAALVCAEAGTPEQALVIALDLEEPVRETGTLLNVVSLIQRMSAERAGAPPPE